MWIIPKNIDCYHCVLDTEELSEDLIWQELDIEQSLMWRSKPSSLRTWLQRWKRVPYIRLLFGRILKPSMQDRFVEEWILSQEAILASHSATQGKEREPKTEDPRHLWPYISRIVSTVRPVWCFFENVEGHLSMGYDQVYRSLRDMGYAVEAGIFSSEEAGGTHQRKRLFILAKLEHSESGRSRGRSHEIGQGKDLGLIGQVKKWATPATRDQKGANSKKHLMRENGERNHIGQLPNAVEYQSLHLDQNNTSGEEPRQSPQNIIRLPKSIRSMWNKNRKSFAKMLGEKVWEETDYRIKAAFKPNVCMSTVWCYEQ